MLVIRIHCLGDDLLSLKSTIGADWLSFRVRDGIGRTPVAKIAKTIYFNNKSSKFKVGTIDLLVLLG